MSVRYVAVQWNRHKRIYDALLLAGVGLYLAGFVIVGMLLWSGREAISPPVLLIRATGTCAFFMLNIILAIGPLARLDRRFAPLLYNRRHFGVTMFGVALAHGALNLGFYHGFGSVNPIISLLSSNTNYASLTGFPFEALGLLALLILFLMAATSHDFWMKFLSPGMWKSLHMLVYVAYGLIVLHVVLGPLQANRSAPYAIAVLCCFAAVSGLHLMTGWREAGRDQQPPEADAGWLDVGNWDEIADRRAKVICLPRRERVAIFRCDGKLSAISNVCAHQGGPLGEGKIVDGCVTCPWHGYQYLANNGQSPPPFTERVPTYRLRIVGRRVLLNPEALPPGTPVEPAQIDSTGQGR